MKTLVKLAPTGALRFWGVILVVQLGVYQCLGLCPAVLGLVALRVGDPRRHLTLDFHLRLKTGSATK